MTTTEEAASFREDIDIDVVVHNIEKKPIYFCSLIVRYPKILFGCALFGHVFVLLLSGSLVASGYDLFPTVFNDMPLQLREDDSFQRNLAWNNRWKDPDMQFVYHNVVSETPVSDDPRTELFETLTIVYEIKGGNVFSPEKLNAIKQLEDDISSQAEYTEYCQLLHGGGCRPAYSILNFFDGTYSMLNTIFDDLHFKDISLTLYKANTNEFLSKPLQYFLGRDSVTTRYEAVSSTTRSTFFFGTPEDSDAFKKFMLTSYKNRLKSLFERDYQGMSIFYFSQSLYSEELESQVILDMVLAVGSFSFIFLFIWVQTGSLWISSLAIFSILASFLGTNLIYRVMLDFKFFGVFHVLAIFLILGIGADDVFLLVDSWKLMGSRNYPNLEIRLSETFRRAAVSMFVTSLTTAIAFLVNAFSPLLGLYSFGIFSGILILYNYLSVILFLPTVIVIYELYLKDLNWCCGIKPFQKGILININLKLLSRTQESQNVEGSEQEICEKSFIVKFFGETYYNFINSTPVRCCVLTTLLGTIAWFTYSATLLTPQVVHTQVFQDDHNYVQFREKMVNSFRPSEEDDIVPVIIVWGLKNQDLSECHKTDYKCTGQTVWDQSFDLDPAPAQIAILKFCENVRNLPDEMITKLNIRRDISSGKVKVNCFIQNMQDFYKLQSEKPEVNFDVSIPISETDVRALMKENPEKMNASALHEAYYRYFETAMAYWLTDSFTGRPTEDYTEFVVGGMLGETTDKMDTTPTVDRTDVYGTRLLFAAISVNTTLSAGTVGYMDGLPVLERWEMFVTEQMSSMPASVSGGFLLTPGTNLWQWLKVQKSLTESAIQGIIYGISLAFPVLVLATQNLIVGTMATFSIACTTVCVIGVIPMAGWKLGVLESLNLSLIVGLAVDYVVHLAEAYHLSANKDRKRRVKDMLECVGVSVISGAATTLGAAFFMLFAVILFFKQFGIFLFCTIGFSLIYSLILFTTLMSMIGPEGEMGSLLPIYHKLRNGLGRKRAADTTKCDHCAGTGYCSSPKVSSDTTTESLALTTLNHL